MTDKRKESSQKAKSKLEIAFRCDSMGSVEAVTHALSEITIPEIDIHIIHSGVGGIRKSDVLLVETVGSLIVGFQVDVLPEIERVLKGHRVETVFERKNFGLTLDRCKRP